MYLAQNYNVIDDDDVAFCFCLKIPDISKKFEDFKRDVEAKKKPPSDKS
uniref:Uncharacterized protein n=1 Tax=Sphenodon punctatus TaxID=8508 RepID=A0A8D0L4L9_SPHPU